MAQQEDNKPTVVTPFVPDAKLESHDFRPVFFQEAGVDPKAESAPEPAPEPPRKRPAKKAAPKASTTPDPAKTATVVGELPPA